MDAIEYLKQKHSICFHYGGNCEQCPLFDNDPCSTIEEYNPEHAIELLKNINN